MFDGIQEGSQLEINYMGLLKFYLNDYSTTSQFAVYQERCFGNDPLSQSKHYQCPKFPGVTLVDSYVRADGTVVDAHWRTNPDGIISNNFSSNK